MDDKQRIALVETQTIENGNPVNAPVPLQRYQLGNHLGSASVELDEDGALISYEEYHPYGTTSFQAGRSAAEVSLKRYRYTGKERDEESGFYYHGARYYAPWLGRWVSVDPEHSKLPDWSSFCYAFASPVVFVDNTGRAPTLSELVAEWSARFNAFMEADKQLVAAKETISRIHGLRDAGTELTPQHIADLREAAAQQAAAQEARNKTQTTRNESVRGS